VPAQRSPLYYVLCIAVRTFHIAPPTGRIIVLGMRLDAAGEPAPDHRACLDCASTLRLRTPDGEIIILGCSTVRGQRSEAVAGAARLLARDVPADCMQTEEQSRHISKNLRIYRARLTVLRGDPPLLMTNRFHLALSPLLAAGSAIAHTSWAAEEVKLPTFHYLPHMLQEALLIHWYVTGCRFACLTGNKAIVALTTWPGRTEPPRGSARPGDRPPTINNRRS
jgi:hypothetical protein